MSLEGHNLVSHHFWRLKNTELNEIFFFMSIRSFVLAMITLFVPIYFLQLGLSIQTVIIYYLVIYGGEALLNYPATLFIRKFGPKTAIILSVPILAVHLLLIRAVGTAHISPIWPALVAAIETAFYWQSYHIDFILSKTNCKAARQVAIITILMAILGALAPFVGGFLTSWFGLGFVIVGGVLGLILATLIFRLPTSGRSVGAVDYDFKRLKFSKIKRDLLANAGSGIDGSGNSIFWPIFVFMIVGSYKAVGLVTSIALLVTILITWTISRRADQGDRKKYIKYGDFTSSILDVIQAFVKSITHIFVINVFGSFSQSMKVAPYTSEYYLRASENGVGAYVFAMETAINIGRVVMLLLLLGASFYLSLKGLLILSFFFAAIGALMVPLMPSSRFDLNKLHRAEVKLSPQPERAK